MGGDKFKDNSAEDAEEEYVDFNAAANAEYRAVASHSASRSSPSIARIAEYRAVVSHSSSPSISEKVVRIAEYRSASAASGAEYRRTLQMYKYSRQLSS